MSAWFIVNGSVCVCVSVCTVEQVSKLWQTIADRLVTACLPSAHLGAVHITGIYFIIIKLDTHC